jgi:hypothetical protein
MGSLFSRVKFPTLVKIATSELGRISDELSSALAELLMHACSPLDNLPASGVMSGLVCSWSGTGMSVRISPGVAFRYDATGISLTGDAALADHPYRLISLREAAAVTLDAADPALDLICFRAGDADARVTSVPIWDPDIKGFNPQNKPLERRNTPALVRVTGTPDVSPVAPSAPAGYLPLYSVLVPAAAADLSAATFTDARGRVPGPGWLWLDTVKRAGDIMTGPLQLTKAIFSGSGMRYILQVGSTLSRGLRVDDSSVSAPVYELVGSGGVAGTKFGAGKLYASDGQIELNSVSTGAFYRLMANAASGRIDAYSAGAISGGGFRAGHLEAEDATPATTTAANVRNHYRDMVPFAMATVVDASPPTFGSGSWNFNTATAQRAATGHYRLPYQQVAGGTGQLVAAVTSRTSSAFPVVDLSDATELNVYLFDATGVAVNGNFCVVVWNLKE